MNINKMNLVFFISSICTFTFNMTIEASREISLENTLLNQANLANMPNDIKIKIINDIVNKFIKNNKE